MAEGEDDGWHWPTLLYIALHILHLPEEVFWKMRPIKFNALVSAHVAANKQEEEDGGTVKESPKKKPTEVADIICIDDAPGWW